MYKPVGIYDRAFCENSKRYLAVNLFRRKILIANFRLGPKYASVVVKILLRHSL